MWMWTGRIETATTLAGNKERAVERLDVLFDVPGLARSQRLATMQTGLAITWYDQALGIREATGWAMARLLLHGVPPLVESSHGIIAHLDVIARQLGLLDSSSRS